MASGSARFMVQAARMAAVAARTAARRLGLNIGGVSFGWRPSGGTVRRARGPRVHALRPEVPGKVPDGTEKVFRPGNQPKLRDFSHCLSFSVHFPTSPDRPKARPIPWGPWG